MSLWCSPSSALTVSLIEDNGIVFFINFLHLFSNSPKELLGLPVDSAKERELARPRVNCESLPIPLHNGVPNLMTQRIIQSSPSW